MKKSTWFEIWRQKAAELKVQTYALYLACRDPRVPWYAKGFTILVVAYAFSPIDLIPDFIPILGYLDDLILIPLGVFLAVRMVPGPVLKDCQERARQTLVNNRQPYPVLGIVVIILLWAAGLALVGYWVSTLLRR
jgi:uncharacterized membrane protein YkvA (DUF1232 family)